MCVFTVQYSDEEDEERAARRANKKARKRGKKLHEIYEPSELERSHFTDEDQRIRTTDEPERFQLRQLPICKADEDEQEEEAKWIYEQAFSVSPLNFTMIPTSTRAHV